MTQLRLPAFTSRWHGFHNEVTVGSLLDHPSRTQRNLGWEAHDEPPSFGRTSNNRSASASELATCEGIKQALS